jgi:uncharacterized lipoprotein YajG
MKKILIYAAVVALMAACSNQPQTTEATEFGRQQSAISSQPWCYRADS